MSKESVISRREARQAAMHVIFAALTGDSAAADCVEGVRTVLSSPRTSRALRDPLAQTIISVFDEQRTSIESRIALHYQRPLETMTMMERALITAAAAEMLAAPGTPAKVIINEAIELAKVFGAEGGATLVNGILDGLAGD